jgi:hypothetical protein
MRLELFVYVKVGSRDEKVEITLEHLTQGAIIKVTPDGGVTIDTDDGVTL